MEEKKIKTSNDPTWLDKPIQSFLDFLRNTKVEESVKRPPPGFIQGRTWGELLIWTLVPLLIGWWIAVQTIDQPAVGIIRLNTDIWSGSAEFLSLQIDEARNNPNIKAVVLQMNSPGGEVAATQTLYLELQSLRREMPVVSSIDGMAASGAYYLAMATDPVFAKPSSTVGNVGVWGFVPFEIGVNDTIIASGPFKLSGSNRAEFLREIEGIKQEFYKTVESSRGDRLLISETEILQGLAYPGRDSMEMGLIDHLGSQTDALDAAAREAGIGNYEVIDLEDIVIKRLLAEYEEIYGSWVGAADPLTGNRTLPPGAYLLYDFQIGGAP